MREERDFGSQLVPTLLSALWELQRDGGQAPSPPWPQPPSVGLDDPGASDLHRPSCSRILWLSLVYFCLTPLPGACGPELVSLAGPDPGSSGGERQANEAKVMGQLAALGENRGSAARPQLPHQSLGSRHRRALGDDENKAGSRKSSLPVGATGSSGPGYLL